MRLRVRSLEDQVLSRAALGTQSADRPRDPQFKRVSPPPAHGAMAHVGSRKRSRSRSRSRGRGSEKKRKKSSKDAPRSCSASRSQSRKASTTSSGAEGENQREWESYGRWERQDRKSKEAISTGHYKERSKLLKWKCNYFSVSPQLLKYLLLLLL